MSRNFVLTAKLTADVSAFKRGVTDGVSGARDLGKALDETAAKARGAEKALDGAAQAARDAGGAGASTPASPGGSGAAPPPRAPSPAEPPGRQPPAQGLAEWQRRNLRSQYIDVATSLYGGMSPLTVLSQQGPQIVEAYGGVQPMLRGIASAFTFARVAALGLTGTVVAGVAAWWQYSEANAAAERALNGVGRASGLTAGGLRDAARRGAAQGGMAWSDALQSAATLASAGVRGDLIPGLTASAQRFAKGFGVELSDASEMVAQAMQDPAKGADALSQKLGFLDGRTRELVRSLGTQGDQFGAQQILAEKFAGSVATLTTNTSALDRAWQGVKRAASEAWSGLGGAVDRAVSGPSLDEQLQTAERRLAEARAQTNGNLWSLQAWHDAEKQKAQAEYDALKARSDAEAKKAADAQREMERNRVSLQATDALRAASPDAARRADLDAQLKLIGTAKADPEIAARVGAVGDLADAEARLKQARASYLDADERQRRSDGLAIRTIQALTVAQRAQIAAERERLSLAGSTEVSASEVARRAQAAAAQVYAADRVAARDKLRDARDSAALVGLTDYDRRLREIAQRWAKETEASQGDPRALADKRAAAGVERAAAMREATLAPMRQARQSLDDQIAALTLHKQAFDASAGAAAELAARQQLLNDLQRSGVPISAELRAEVERYAAAQGRVAQASDDLRRAQERVVSGMDDIRAQARGAFSGMLGNLRDGKSVTDGLLDSATRMIDRVIEARVTGPLVEGLLGKDGKAGGGLFGDTVAGWLGGKTALQTATISAATVIVNGQATSAGMAATERKPLDIGRAANDSTSALPGGGSWALAGRYQAAGVDQRLTDILRTAAERSGLDVRAVSGLRLGDSRFHGRGLATDVQIIDPATGRALPNYQDGSAFRAYEQYAQAARSVQMERYPELADQFRWGGYFGGGRGNYGALDTMHFDLGGGRAGMAGGSWASGLTDAQRRLWPTAYSQGMSADGFQPSFAAQLPREFERLATSAARASDATGSLGADFQSVSKALSTGSGSLENAASGVTRSAASFQTGADGIFSTILSGVGAVGNNFVGGLGTVLQTLLQALSQSGGGGGFGSLISPIFGGATTGTYIPYAMGGVHTPGGPMMLPRFARGGVSASAAIFGEAGPEAAVPLPDGRSIPVQLRIAGKGANDAAASAPLTALAGALGRLNDRLAAANAPREASTLAGPAPVIENRSGARVTMQEEQAPGGGRRHRAVIEDTIADVARRPGNRIAAALRASDAVGRR